MADFLVGERPVYVRKAIPEFGWSDMLLFFHAPSGYFCIAADFADEPILRCGPAWHRRYPSATASEWLARGSDEGVEIELSVAEREAPQCVMVWSHDSPTHERGCQGDYAYIGDLGGRPAFERLRSSKESYYLYFAPGPGRWVISSSLCADGGHIHAVAPDSWSAQVPEEVKEPWQRFDSAQGGPVPGPFLSVQSASFLRPPSRVFISGRCGRNNSINGDYFLQPPVERGCRPVYKKDDKGFVKWLYFWVETGHWQISMSCMDREFLARAGPDWSCATPDLVVGPWQVFEGCILAVDEKVRLTLAPVDGVRPGYRSPSPQSTMLTSRSGVSEASKSRSSISLGASQHSFTRTPRSVVRSGGGYSSVADVCGSPRGSRRNISSPRISSRR